MTNVQTPAGWYDDGAGRTRWWDGAQWTHHFAPVATQQQPAVQQSTVVIPRQKMYKTSHGFHLVMSLITLGLWLPVWLIVGLYNAAKS